MITWNNLDTLESFKELSNVKKVNLVEAMTGENGAERVKNYSVPMAAGLAYNYAAKQVDDEVLEGLKKLAKEAQLTEKYAALYNGEMINTGEKRLVLHQLTRGQLGGKVEADGVDKREFYVTQQKRIAEFANQVHAGEEAAVLDGRPPAEAVRDVSAALLGSRQHDFARRTGVIVEHRIGTHEAVPQIPVDAFGGGRQTSISGRKVPQKQGGNEQRRKLEHE